MSGAPIELETSTMMSVRRIAEAIAKHHGRSTMIRHEDDPWVVHVDLRDSAATVDVVHVGNPHMLSVTAFGFSGRAEGNVALIEGFLEHFGVALSAS